MTLFLALLGCAIIAYGVVSSVHPPLPPMNIDKAMIFTDPTRAPAAIEYNRAARKGIRYAVIFGLAAAVFFIGFLVGVLHNG